MKKQKLTRLLSSVVLIAIIFLTGCVGQKNQNKQSQAPTPAPIKEEQKELTPIKIGWQTPWATQGQLTQVLKQTELLKENNLKGEFIGFSYGGPLNVAALAGELDVIFTADQPAAQLLSKNPNWTIIGRLMYNRVSLYVPPKSSINSTADLKGKKVAMPFGAAAQRMALQAQKNAGLNPKTDVENLNLGIYEQSVLVNDKEATKWGEFDAMAGFDPTPAIYADKGLVRNNEVGKIVSLIVMSNDFIQKNPEAPVNFLKAFQGAYDYYKNNVEQANKWFTDEAKLDITPNALATASSIEPNMMATSKAEIRLDFIEDDYRIMQEAADFLLEQNMIQEKLEMKNFVNLSYLQKALQ
jgi:sulfonate transport system substrate-binding protein